MRSRLGTNRPRHGTKAGIVRAPRTERTDAHRPETGLAAAHLPPSDPGSEVRSEEPHPPPKATLSSTYRPSAPSGYKRQRIALAVIVLKMVALETAGTRSQRQSCSGIDAEGSARENHSVAHPGASRKQLARTLNAAYAGGLLTQDTFERRIDQVLKAHLIDPLRIIGDLNLRASARRPAIKLVKAFAVATRRVALPDTVAEEEAHPRLLALDWNGRNHELLLGRHHGCDVVFSNLNVSRRHARLVFRDGSWILYDLQSTNGTFVNGVRVGRCELFPGDRLALGDEALRVD